MKSHQAAGSVARQHPGPSATFGTPTGEDRQGLLPSVGLPLLLGCLLAGAARASLSAATPQQAVAQETLTTVGSSQVQVGTQGGMSSATEVAGDLQAGASLPVTLEVGTSGSLTTPGGSVLNFERTSSEFFLKGIGTTGDPLAFLFKKLSLWEAEFLPMRRSDEQDVVIVRPEDCDYELDVTVQGNTLLVTWSDVRTPLLPTGSAFEVTLEVGPSVDGNVFEIDLQMDTTVLRHSLYATTLHVYWVERGVPADGVLAYPTGTGELIPDPVTSLRALEEQDDGFKSRKLGVHPGAMSMQWWAYYDSAEAAPLVAFFGTRDPQGDRKEFLIETNDSEFPPAFRFGLRRFPDDNRHARRTSATYPMVMRVLAGGRDPWYDAAQEYRSWAMTQAWVQGGPVESNPDYSTLMREAQVLGYVSPGRCFAEDPTTCSMTDHQTADYWASDAAERMQFLGVDHMVDQVVSFLDHNASFGKNLGEWLPLRLEALAQAPLLAAQPGLSFGPYFLNFKWSDAAPGWSPVLGNPNLPPWLHELPVERYARRDAFGRLDSTTKSVCFKTLGCGAPKVTVEHAQLCLASQFAIDYTVHQVEALRQGLGSSGVYLDVYTNGSAKQCHATWHRHSPPSASEWTQSKLALLDVLRAAGRANDPGFFVQSEGVQEYYLGRVEAFLRNVNGSPVDHAVTGKPLIRHADLWGAVYGGYALKYAHTLPLNLPEDNSLFANPATRPYAMQLLRQQYAADGHYGNVPSAHTILSPSTIADKNTPTYPEYQDWVSLAQNYVAVLKEEEVRDYLGFGRSLRDPETVGIPTVELLRGYGNFWPGLENENPMVYVTARRRQADDSTLGIFCFNWTSEDDTPASIPNLGSADPGSQSFDVILDPVDYALSNGLYSVSARTRAGVQALADIDFSSGSPQTLSLTVDALEAVFVKLEPK